MNIIKVLSLIGCCYLALCSCTVHMVGYNSGISHLSQYERERVVKNVGRMDSHLSNDTIYQVSVEDVLAYVVDKPAALVYEYSTYCRGENCLLPEEVERMLDGTGISLCLVSTVYDNLYLKTGRYSHPVFAIDPTPYGTDIQAKYTRSFFEKLTGQSWKDIQGRYHLFVKGTYQGSYATCKEAIENAKSN